MKDFIGKYRYSQLLMLITLIMYGIDFVLDGSLSRLLALDPTATIDKLELWRLLSFPFVPGSYEGIAIFAVTFGIIGPKLERTLRSNLYPLILLLLICLQGTLLTLVFLNFPYTFSGMEGLSFFVLSLFLLMNLNKKIVASSRQPVKALILASVFMLFWVLATIIHSLATNYTMLVTNGINAVFGLLSGSLIFIQMKLFKRRQKNFKDDLSQYEIPDPDQLSMALISQKEKKKHYHQEQEEMNHYEFEENLSEDRLNEILDKINETGKESLSNEELRFLDEYSKNL